MRHSIQVSSSVGPSKTTLSPSVNISSSLFQSRDFSISSTMRSACSSPRPILFKRPWIAFLVSLSQFIFSWLMVYSFFRAFIIHHWCSVTVVYMEYLYSSAIAEPYNSISDSLRVFQNEFSSLNQMYQ